MGSLNTQEAVVEDTQNFVRRVAAILTGQSPDTLSQIYQEVVSEAIECDLVELRQVFERFVEEVPYLSPEQLSVLRKDISQVFDELELPLRQTISGMQKQCEALRSRIIHGTFSFEGVEIPRDAFNRGVIERIAREVVRECFGSFIQSLPPQEAMAMEMRVDRAIAEQLRNENIPVGTS